MEYKSKLDHLADHDCTRCDLHEDTERVCIMGRGSPKSRIMLIGEAPGGNEEYTGKVFSGRAGQLLDTYLREAGLSERRPYITNAVKCRPEENRNPTAVEWEACRRYLRREIEAVGPVGVLFLGGVALRAAWGAGAIGKNRGVRLKHTKLTLDLGLGESQLMATWHPAYILRNPGQGTVLAEDIKRFRRMMDGTLEAKSIRVQLVTTEDQLRRVCRYLKTQPVLSYDVENRYAPWNGKEWYLLCLGISATGDRSFVIPLRHPDSSFRKKWRRLLRDYVKPVLDRGDVKLVGQNAKHDNLQLAGAGVFLEHTFDIMLAAHLLDENRPKNLGFLSQTILGADTWKGSLDLKPEQILKQDYRTICLANGYDVGYTRQLYEPLKDELKVHPRLARLFVKLLMPASHTLQQVEYAGVYINPNRLFERIDILNSRIEEQLAVIYEAGAPEGMNPNSTQQLAMWLFGKSKKGGLGLDPIEVTKTGAYSTKESVLLHYREVPAIQALLEYRTLQLKWMNTNLLPWSVRLDARSRIHTTYKIYGTVTGRLSGDLQQVPRDPFIRTVFGAPEGWRFIQADYSQIELRIAAHVAHERRMIRAFNTGEDIHSTVASMITGRSISEYEGDITFKLKEERKLAKAVDFGFVYGMYPKKFQAYAFENYGLLVSLAEAEKFRDQFFKMFPDLEAWHRRQETIVRSRGYVQSPLGRIRHLPNVYSGDGAVAREAVRQAINSPVQGCATDLMLYGMVQLYKVLDPAQCFMVMTLHDGIMFQCKEDKVDYWALIIKETLETLPIKRTFGADISVPIVSDVEWGQHWGEVESHL